MTFDLYWRALRWLALEHLHLEVGDDAVSADGVVVGLFGTSPLRVRYRIGCDRDWRTTSLRVGPLAAEGDGVELRRAATGEWLDADGVVRDDLTDAVDVDIAATPFTNTLPIRRLRLARGESRELAVVYVAVVPRLEARLGRQRYTRLGADAGGERYLYESLESDFAAELLVDADGFVLDYPGVWERIGQDDPAGGVGGRER